jgi:hypothetical protein
MAHFAHYIKRTIARSDNELWEGKPRGEEFKSQESQTEASKVTLPFAENQPDDQGFNRPSYHSVPRGSRAQTGDTFWLFSQLRTPWGTLPPSLDARILICDRNPIYKAVTGKDGKEHGVRRIRLGASCDSEWFPIFDASNLIDKLCSISALRGAEAVLSASAKHVGQALRFPREIANPELLIEHARTVESAPLDFISYRMQDGTPVAFKHALERAQLGRAVLWDRWSLPRRMSERGECLSRMKLDERIQQQIEKSERVYGVWSPTYGAEKTYSLLEKELATSLNKFELVKLSVTLDQNRDEGPASAAASQ